MKWLDDHPLEFRRFGSATPSSREFVPRSLYVVRAGIQYSRPNYQTGPKRLPWYTLVLVLNGEGWLLTDKGRWPLQSGHVFCVFPRHTTTYGTDPEKLFVSAWVSFRGTEAKSTVDILGLSHAHPCLKTDLQNTVYPILSQIREELIIKDPGYMLRTSGLLWQAIGCLQSTQQELHFKLSSYTDDQMEDLAGHIADNFNNIESISQLARSMGFSRSYVTRKFKEVTGMSPHSYLTQCRIRHAQQLLRKTDLAVKAIALSVGYKNAYYFSRAFTSLVGIPPSTYRHRERRESADA